ncbi:hypothetical protein CDV55_107262 [Aspergillus turcosus]|nr:hypothetical protein CDV55_107262 [Aspergillus turcosus]
MTISKYSNDEYKVGWICALPIELVAAKAMLDEEHGDPQTPVGRHDHNTYMLGSIGNHKVVVACLPRDEYGSMSAAAVAKDMMHAFPQIRFGVLVGIGAGIPDYESDEVRDIRLGDVVVGSDNEHSGVVLYDFGKKLPDGSFKAMYALDRPPRSLRTALSRLEAERMLQGSQVSVFVDRMLEKYPALRDSGWSRPDSSKDRLFNSDYSHVPGRTCKKCDASQEVDRDDWERSSPKPVIHYGVIATGSELIKHAPSREEIRERHRAICLEMEAAGLMNHFPCLVIRGISDYADSHKNTLWRNYAAATAAAFAKELLEFVAVTEVDRERSARDILNEVRKDISTVKENVSELRTLAMQGTHARLLDWLSPNDFSSQQHDIISRRKVGTGLWFLESDEFQGWLGQSGQTLFCPGIPGAGKTVMAAIIVDYLQAKFQHDPQVYVGYLFCSYQPQYGQKVEEMLRSLLRQAVSHRTEMPPHIKDLYDRHNSEKKRKQPFLDETSTELRRTAQLYDRSFIIIDALDELYASDYESHQRLLKEMSFLQRNDSISLLITSRFNSDIMSHFEHTKQKEISAQDDDLLLYINEKIPLFKSKAVGNEGIQQEIRNGVLKAADGMFLLARLHMEHLTDKPSIGLLKEALQTLPQGRKGLTETYQQAIMRIDQQSEDFQTIAWQALSWIAYSKRAILSEELRHALATHPSMIDFDKDYLLDIGLITSSCAGLIVKDTETDIVRLVHYTTQDFLLSQRILPNAEQYIANTCITYLSFEPFAGGPCSTESVYRGRLNQYPLYEYSARYWGSHAANPPTQVTVQVAALEFLRKRGNVLAAHQVLLHKRTQSSSEFLFELRSSGTQLRNRSTTSLHIAAHFGLTDLLRILIEGGAEVNATDEKGATPLVSAVKEGHVNATVFLITESGANPKLKDVAGGTAMAYAAMYGYEAIVRFLLDWGVEPEPQCEKDYDCNPLHLAAANGHVSVMKLLLHNGAMIDALDSKMSTPLALAVQQGHQSAVKLLLDRGSDQNLVDDHGDPLVCVAARNGHEAIVRLLLSRGADPAARDRRGKTPLLAAMASGDEGTISLLLTLPFDVNAHDSDRRTALSYAVEKGNVSRARFLIEKGAKLNVKVQYLKQNETRLFPSTRNLTALALAADQGNEVLARLLLEKGADPNLECRLMTETPLGIAAFRGHLGIVKLLFKYGADLNLQDEAMENALFSAAQGGDDEVISLLVKAGADPRRKNIVGNTPLFYAVENLNGTAINILLASGNDVNERNELMETPLFFAARQGYPAIVKLLLEKGADPDPKNMLSETPLLQAASYLGEKRNIDLPWRMRVIAACPKGPSRDLTGVMRLLLEHGANPNPICDPQPPPDMRQLNGDVGFTLQIEEAHKLWPTCMANLPDELFHMFIQDLGKANCALVAWRKKMETPLIWASHAGCTEIVDLIKHMSGSTFGVKLEEPPSTILSPADKQKIDASLAKFLQPTKMVTER